MNRLNINGALQRSFPCEMLNTVGRGVIHTFSELARIGQSIVSST